VASLSGLGPFPGASYEPGPRGYHQASSGLVAVASSFSAASDYRERGMKLTKASDESAAVES